MQHLLRATSGPQAGAVYVLGRRTTIGRASDCDIQILHEGVSRRHAKITQQPDGSMIVTDLSSDNGTFVGEQRVTRHRLQSGEAIRIMRSRFTYAQDEGSKHETSPIFRQKVTSGESLRQTADHGKSLAAIRAGMAKGLAGDRGRSHTRPQAAAPAPAGARPGVVGPGPDDGPDAIVSSIPAPEPFEGRRPTPVGPTVAPSESGGRRRGSVLSTEYGASTSDSDPLEPWEKPTREIGPPSRGGLVTMGLSTEAPDGTLSIGAGDRQTPVTPRVASGRSSDRAPDRSSPDEGLGSYGWHADESRRGRRSGPTRGGSTLASVNPVPARAERTSAASPSGRMAPSAPSGVASSSGRMAPVVPSVTPPEAIEPPPRSAGNGWVRLSRPTDAPQSMRPGSTLSGVPPVDDGPIPPAASTAGGAPPTPEAASDDAPRRGTTAEYGAMPPGPGAPQPQSRGPETEADLEQVRTHPRIRRTTESSYPQLGSATPTEEVPRIEAELSVEEALDEVLDDDAFETRPRIARGPRTTVMPTKVPTEAAEPDLEVVERATTEPEAAKRKTATPETTEPETAKPETAKPETAKPETAKPETTEPATAKPDIEAAEPEATETEAMEPETAKFAVAGSEPAVDTERDDERDDPMMDTRPFRPSFPLQGEDGPQIVIPLPGTKSRGTVAYEDTLRMQRPREPPVPGPEPAAGGAEADAGAPAPEDDAPQVRKHLSTGELIDALEELLPIDDDPRTAVEPDAPTVRHASRTGAGPYAPLGGGGHWDPEQPGLLDDEGLELEVQHALEQGREDRQRLGLRCLVDILEYRELRTRALRGETVDSRRYNSLEDQLQQHPLGIDDDAAMRRYTRFACSIPAQLTHRVQGSVRTVSVEVRDLSAGGARLTFGEYSIDPGEIIWLAFDLSQADRQGTIVPDANTVVFKARVVWSRTHEAQLGLIFAGAPQYDADVVIDVDG
ncbi:MAG: FHA domain-containing protein [Myxococcota bacterium]